MKEQFEHPRELSTRVLIVGGGTGGCAAALALSKRGIPTILTEPTTLLGGQLSSQGVPPDENQWIESTLVPNFHGANASYIDLRNRIRAHYRANESLTDHAHNNEHLNPGDGWVSRLCFEPRLADTIIREMLEESGASNHLTIFHKTNPIYSLTNSDCVEAVVFDREDEQLIITADLILDATETGDLYGLAGIEHTIGAEAQHIHNELHARIELPKGQSHDPLDQQAITWCFAVEHHQGENFTTDAPANYEFWRSFKPDMMPAWSTNKLFSWNVPSHNDEGKIRLPLVPYPDEPAEGTLELWRYRRIVSADHHTDTRPDVALFNVVQIDQMLSPLLGVTPEERAEAEQQARELSLCFLHWMRTEAPHHDSDALGYPGLKLSGSALASSDGFALAPYIREPRRLLARTILTEQHLGTEQRQGLPNQDASPFGAGEPFADAIAIGHYPIDLHPSCAGRNSLYIPATPFRVPLGALIPQRVRNVIAAGKGIGVTHIANGATRLHPVEWGIGEAAATLAAMCIINNTEPHTIADSLDHTRELRQHLADSGVPLRWPWEEPANDTAPQTTA